MRIGPKSRAVAEIVMTVSASFKLSGVLRSDHTCNWYRPSGTSCMEMRPSASDTP